LRNSDCGIKGLTRAENGSSFIPQSEFRNPKLAEGLSMRIAVFSDLYPPLFIGGYELGAAAVVEELRRRGHDVMVLSCHEYYQEKTPGRFTLLRHAKSDRAAMVDVGLCLLGYMPRLLRLRPLHFVQSMLATRRARRRYQEALTRFHPDAFFLFNPMGVAAPVIDDCVAYARREGVPAAVYLSDHWLEEWPACSPTWQLLHRLRKLSGPLGSLVEGIACRALGGLGLLPQLRPAPTHLICCSDFIRRRARGYVPGAVETVVPWGLAEVAEPPALPNAFEGPEPLSLVYAGQLVEHKGLAVLLEALAHCRRPHRLDVIGDDRNEYATHCKRQVAERGLGAQVRFLGRKPREQMAGLLRRAQVLVLPSQWDEPFSIVVLEGMRAGLAVVATDTGGTAEAIDDGVTGCLFARGDSAGLTGVLDRLDADRSLCRRLADGARQRVRQRYTLDRMVDRLLEVVAVPSTRHRRRAA
jgi:glycosyltransferase involved in cell wall biosynthesis